MNLDTAVSKYLVHLEFNDHRSPGTLSKYRQHLTALQRHVGDVPLTEIRPSHLFDFVAELGRERRHSAATTALVICAVRSFFGYCMMAELITGNPALALKSPRRSHQFQATLSLEDLRKLLAGPIPYNGRFDFSARDGLIVRLMALTGIRRAEVCALRWGDVDLAGRTIRVRGKGRRERMVPLVPDLAQELAAWRAQSTGEFVFQGRRSDRLQPDAVTAIFDRHVSQALPGKRITPHVLRRTFATLLHQNGGSLLAISRLLGHASVTTTAEHYVQVDADDLRQAVARHPLSGAVQLQLPGM